MSERIPAALVLEDGRIFRGHAFGTVGETLGEAVFTTGMTGYQETLTDPSYRRQIVVSTAPQIGNTGWNLVDGESMTAEPTNDAVRNGMRGRIYVAGYVIRDYAHQPCSWRLDHALQDELEEQQIVGIQNVDTRAIVRHLRAKGSLLAGIFSGDSITSEDGMLEKVCSQPPAAGQDLASEVTTQEMYTLEPVEEHRFTIAAIDLGIKANTPRNFVKRGLRVHMMPAATTWEEIQELNVDGLFFSNGPGDPITATAPIALANAALENEMPLFGICFGNQIFGRALGLDTYKMKFGHRGINIPVKDHQTGRIAITSQNHGFALEGEPGMEFDTPYGRALISHSCPNDDTVEGVKLLDGSAFSVQYHPEACAGPHDANYLFDQFVDLLESHGKKGQK